MPDASAPPDPSVQGMGRLLALTDGVFAFAVTLLVLDLTVPSLTQPTSASLLVALRDQYVSFLSYLISFFVVGVWWAAHHRLYSYILRFDNALRWLNLLFLLPITLVPYFTRLADQYSSIRLPWILYTLDLCVAALLYSALWHHASTDRRLLNPEVSEELVRWVSIRTYLLPGLFAVGVLIAFSGEYAALSFAAAGTVLTPILLWTYGRRHGEHP